MSANTSINVARKRSLWSRIIKHRNYYIMIIPALLIIVIFSYLPMTGLLLSFKEYRFRTPSAFGDIPVLRFLGQIVNMEWVGMRWFNSLLALPDFQRALVNTIRISVCRLIIEFPMPIILAVLMNEVSVTRVKRVFQTIYTFPHFLSWVLVMSILQQLLNVNGTVNNLLVAMGFESYPFLIEASTIQTVVHTTSIWKGVGWGSIIYMATIAGIDPSLYEAAVVDGANRWHRIRYITMPSLKPIILIMFILNCGSILNAGFDQIFNLVRATTRPRIEIFDVFIYRFAFRENKNFSLTIAAGMFKSVFNFIFLLAANQITKLVGEEGLI